MVAHPLLLESLHFQQGTDTQEKKARSNGFCSKPTLTHYLITLEIWLQCLGSKTWKNHGSLETSLISALGFHDSIPPCLPPLPSSMESMEPCQHQQNWPSLPFPVESADRDHGEQQEAQPQDCAHGMHSALHGDRTCSRFWGWDNEL